MKKILIILSFFAMITSCGKLEDLNKNIKDPAVVPGETLFTGAQKRIMDQMVSTNVNLNVCRLLVQYWTETTYFDESNYDLSTRSQPDRLWNIFYVNVLKNLKEANTVISDAPIPAGEDPAVKQNKLAIVEIMAVYSWDVLVTTFGNVPYSDAIDIEKPLPKYDDALTVSTALLARLDAAIGQLNDGFDSFGSADNMYHGDVALWAKFANSLKLRMAMELSDVASLQSTVKAAVESAAPNVLSSNADNAKIIYLSALPNTNPLYVDLVSSGRNDFVIANTLTDVLNDLQDPRLYKYFSNRVSFEYRADEDTGTKMDSVLVTGPGKLYFYPNVAGGDSLVYKEPPYTMFAADSNINITLYNGGIPGASNNFLSYSHVADLIQTPTFPGTMFDYSEVEFLLAEAVERGFDVGGTAEEHYNKAVAASIEDWGGTALDAAAYLADPKVAYATAAGDWKQKIGMQSWIAYYNRGFEAWTQFRRLDYPALVAPPDALSALPIRYTYPIEEQTLNGTNWDEASTAIGGDAVDTPLFWDTHYDPAK